MGLMPVLGPLRLVKRQGGQILAQGFKAIAISAALLVPSAAVSAPLRYFCDIDQSGTQGWIAPQIVILHEPGGKIALVNDGLIATVLKAPVKAKVAAENAKRVTFTWSLPFMKDKGNQVAPKFSYRASYYKQTGKMMVSAIPNGYNNNFQGFGTCRVE
jgi:hypothetical protein